MHLSNIFSIHCEFLTNARVEIKDSPGWLPLFNYNMQMYVHAHSYTVLPSQPNIPSITEDTDSS